RARTTRQSNFSGLLHSLRDNIPLVLPKYANVSFTSSLRICRGSKRTLVLRSGSRLLRSCCHTSLRFPLRPKRSTCQDSSVHQSIGNECHKARQPELLSLRYQCADSRRNFLS